MTQKSYPWPGVAPASGADAGRYTAQEWNAAWATMARAGGVVRVAPNLRTLATVASLGVFYSVANRLEVTSPGDNDISVATGAALVCGKEFYHDTAITGVNNIISPAANPRIDRVVTRVNFMALDYTPPWASAADFTVPAYTARVTVIHGAENVAPTAPALTQDQTLATYWDVPLAQYRISVAGAISGLMDEREWVDVEAKRIFVPALMGYNATDVTDVPLGWITDHPIIAMIDNKVVRAWGKFAFPADYVASMTSEGVFIVSGGGGSNIYADNAAYLGACGEVAATHTSSVGFAAEAFSAATRYSCHRLLTVASRTPGDLVITRLVRDGTDPLDTLAATAYLCGWKITYVGWR